MKDSIIKISLILGSLFVLYFTMYPHFKYFILYYSKPTIYVQDIYKQIYHAKVLKKHYNLYQIYINSFDGTSYHFGTTHGYTIVDINPEKRLGTAIWPGFRIWSDGDRVKKGKLCGQ